MEIAQHWRMQGERLRLEGSSCTSCGAARLGAASRCEACGGTTLRPVRFSGLGELWSHALVQDAPEGFAEQAPYLVGWVRLEEGPLVAAPLTDMDPSEARIGLPVEMVTRRVREDGPDGLIVYGYKFRPRFFPGAPTS